MTIALFRATATDMAERLAVGAEWPRLYRRGVVMNLTNPKVAIFFTAFLPQFADPASDELTVQLLLLGGLFIVATLLIFGSVALTAGDLGDWLKGSTAVQIVMNRVAGTVFIALALRLALSHR